MIKITKKPNKDFVVLNLTDFNLDNNDWNNDLLIKHFKETVHKLIEITKPDLITVSGDFSRSDLLDCYYKTADFIKSLDLPYAFCLGNHDNQDGHERSIQIADILSNSNKCVFEKGDDEFGVGNYIIQIMENDKPIHSLVFMDSHNMDEIVDENNNKKYVWSRLTKKQLKWYKNNVLTMGINTTLITHIPLFEYRTAFEKAFNHEFNQKNVNYEDSLNSKYWNKGYEKSFGVCHEDICSCPFNCDEFSVIKDSKFTKLILVGHDHANNFVINHEGIKLAYATKTGKGCYFDEGINGGTLLRINESGVEIKQIICKI